MMATDVPSTSKPKGTLAIAVAEGVITQAQADAIIAIKARKTATEELLRSSITLVIYSSVSAW